jgi:hypothetical protein
MKSEKKPRINSILMLIAIASGYGFIMGAREPKAPNPDSFLPDSDYAKFAASVGRQNLIRIWGPLGQSRIGYFAVTTKALKNEPRWFLLLNGAAG